MIVEVDYGAKHEMASIESYRGLARGYAENGLGLNEIIAFFIEKRKTGNW